MSTSFSDPIIVTGPPRSGTSLTSGILHECGAWVGDCFPGTSSNPKGFFENKVIREQIIKPMLSQRGIDPLGQFPLDGEYKPAPELRRRVFSAIDAQGYIGGPWLMKGIKVALMWREWAEAFPDARWIIVRRDIESAAESCRRAPFMTHYSGLDEWSRYILAYICKAGEIPGGRLVFTPDVAGGRFDAIKAAAADCGLKWNSKAEQFFDDKAWHGFTFRTESTDRARSRGRHSRRRAESAA